MIKPLLFTFFTFYCINVSTAQSDLKYWELSGELIDSATQKPVAHSSISLNDNKRNIKLTTTNEKGLFTIKLSSEKKIYLLISKIGYKTRRIDFDLATQKKQLGTITLTPLVQDLKEVNIVTPPQLVKRNIDRIQYNVQQDPEKEIISALSMLRKVPMISIDGSDGIKLKGGSSFKILINGKPSSLLSTNSTEVLRSMPAENIQSIEVITNPPAKYDGEGLTGIINIVMQRKKNEGYNISLSTRNNNVYGPNTNINGGLKKGLFAFSGIFGTNRRKGRTTTKGIATDIFSPGISSIIQNAYVKDKGDNQYGSLEMSIEPDSLNLITGEFHFNNSTSNVTDTRQHTHLSNSKTIIEQVKQTSTLETPISSLDFSGNYQKRFNRNKNQILTVSYNYNYNKNNLWSTVLFSDQINNTLSDFNQENHAGLKEHAAQIDFSQTFDNRSLELGVKGIFRKNKSDFETLVQNNNKLLIDPSKSNIFEYLQKIYSAYGTYQFNLQSWVIKTGARLEATKIDADFKTTRSIVVDNYLSLLPSLAIQKQLGEFNNLNLGYSERIERPNIEFLNPFIDRSNPQFISGGNPTLNPVRGRQIDLSYARSKNNSINITMSYSFNKNGIQRVTNIGQDTISSNTYMNIGKDKRLTGAIDFSSSINQNILLSFNGDIQRVWLKGYINSAYISRTGYQWHAMVFGSVKFVKYYSLSLDVSYDSRYVLIQGTDNDFFSTGASLSRTFKSKRLNIAVFTSNPFNKFVKFDYKTTGYNFSQSSYNNVFYRRYGLSITYKLRNLKTQIKAIEKKISNDDKIDKRTK